MMIVLVSAKMCFIYDVPNEIPILYGIFVTYAYHHFPQMVTFSIRISIFILNLHK